MFAFINQSLVSFAWGVASKPVGEPRGGIINLESESREITVHAETRRIDVIPEVTGGR